MKNKIWKIEFDLDWGLRHPRRYIEFYYEGNGNKKPDNDVVYALYVKMIKSINRKRKDEGFSLFSINEHTEAFIKDYFTVAEIKLSHHKTKIHHITVSK